jgi:hypothetical protein
MANKNCNNTSKINAIQNLIKNSWGWKQRRNQRKNNLIL